jgi:hypothetical protein
LYVTMGRFIFCGKLLIRETRKVDKALLPGKARAKSRGVRIWEVPPFANNAKDGPPAFAEVKGGPLAPLAKRA